MDRDFVFGLIVALCVAFALGGLAAWQHRSENPFRTVIFVPPFEAEGAGRDGVEDFSHELVTLESTGEDVVDLSGWTLSNSRGDAFTFPAGFSLPARTRVTVHSGCGENSPTDLFWCSSRPVWGDEKDEAILRTASGGLVDVHSYDRECPLCTPKGW